MLIFVIVMFMIFVPVSAEDIEYRGEMIKLIGEIRKRSSEGKIIIVQNSTDLFYKGENLNRDLLSKIDGVSQESLIYGYGGYNKKTPSHEMKEILQRLTGIREENNKILLIEYTDKKHGLRKIKKYKKKYDFMGEALKGYEADSLYEPIGGFNSRNIESLEDAENFLCLLNPEKFGNLENYVKILERLDYDLLIIDAFHMGRAFTPSQVERLKQKSDGSRRLVVAYFSIGEAESYRDYWKKEWDKDIPGWIVEENPNWKDNYIVEYWSSDWKDIIENYQKKIDLMGFDGYFLDTVDTYQFFLNEE